ncbi:MAG TPA: hypothetical protein VEJ67_14225 [Candidatus Cybelea sp.]|nr:hypothetical protein [Candidatus Cybelea sp.]
MPDKLGARLVGIELYFDGLQKGKQVCGGTLALDLLDQLAGHQTLNLVDGRSNGH